MNKNLDWVVGEPGSRPHMQVSRCALEDRNRDRCGTWPSSITQELTLDWLFSSGLEGEELLLDALRRRGFLAFRDDEGIWLGTGSHPADLTVLRLVEGMVVDDVQEHPEKMAGIRLWPDMPYERAAGSIANLPQHRGFSGFGPGGHQEPDWYHYRAMVWGAKRAVCTAQRLDRQCANDPLDIGIALLVKTLALARVATALSCDGHGTMPAWVTMYYPWDPVWGSAVFDILDINTPNSLWNWDSPERNLTITPVRGYGDTEVLGMLNDIQACSRRLMNQSVIDRIGLARSRTLDACSGWRDPPIENFREHARVQLALAFD